MRIIYALVIATFASIANADPDSVTDHLMDESPSLLDWGLMRLENKLESNDKLLLTPTVTFDWNSDTITIFSFDTESPSENTKEESVQHCSEWFEIVRTSAGVSPWTNELRGQLASVFSVLFAHNGYRRHHNGKSIDDFLHDLDNKFLLEFHSFFTEPNGDPNMLVCTGVLISGEINHALQIN